MKKAITVFIFLFGYSAVSQVKLDSLWNVWNNKAESDTSRLKAIKQISWDGYLFTQPDSAFYYAQLQYDFAENRSQKGFMAKAQNTQGASYYIRGEYKKAIIHYANCLEIYNEIDDKTGISNSLNNLGLVYKEVGEHEKAIGYYHKCLELDKEQGDKIGPASSYNNIGVIYYDQGNYAKAIEYFVKSMKVFEEVGDTMKLTASLTNIGIIYSDQGDYKQALEFLNKSLKASKGSKEQQGNNLNSIGIVYFKMLDFKLAEEYQFKGLEIRKELGDNNGIATSLNNIGSIYNEQMKYSEAKEYYLKSLEIYEQMNDVNGVSAALNSVGSIYLKIGDLNKAEEYSSRALEMSQELGVLMVTKDASNSLYKIYRGNGDYKKSLSMYELFIITRDSLYSEANQKEVIRQEYKYKYDKQVVADSITNAEAQKVKDALLSAEKAENKQHQLEAKQQKQYGMFLYGILGLSVLFGVFIFNRFRITKKQKGIIEKQKVEVDSAFDELEEKNTEIMDSINYAKRIQSAILPPTKVVKEYLKQSFILYKPKDIVAGDFYWLEHVEGKILFAAADCTGHGVPGAMVSVVCNNGLNRSVREHGLTDPGKILDKTREIVIQEFEKSEDEVKDGMDIALCSLEGMTLEYAGAHNPLWIIRKGEVLETKANKQPIGKFDKQSAYTTHTFELQKGDTIYIFSDGYVDQFGGIKGKKFKSKAFRELLLNVQDQSMELQRDIINEAFENWRGSLEQIDDVCVIGVRV